MKFALFLAAVLAMLASAFAVEKGTATQAVLATAGASASASVRSNEVWELEFVGTAVDVTLGGNIRQRGDGNLTIVAVSPAGDRTVIDSFSVHSGPMNNGLLPNGNWVATAPIDSSNQFRDETGYGYKMRLSTDAATTGSRGSFLIHSTPPMNNKYYGISKGFTEGCIGNSGGHEENVRFYDLMLGYFKKNKSIKVKVAIEGNANVNVQLKNAPTYVNAPKWVAPKPAAKPKAPKRAPVRRRT